jgi:hypothetical protein
MSFKIVGIILIYAATSYMGSSIYRAIENNSEANAATAGLMLGTIIILYNAMREES